MRGAARRPLSAAVPAAAALLIVALALLGLSRGAGMLVPLAEALMVWFILNRFASAIVQVPHLGPAFGRRGALGLAILIVFGLGLASVYSGVRGLLAAGPQALGMTASLDLLFERIAATFGNGTAEALDRMVDAIGLERLMQELVLGLVSLINQFGVVAILVAFLLVDQAIYPAKMRALFPDPARRARVEALLSELSGRISSYLWMMTQVSALTAMLSGLVMLLLGLENVLFWSILIFALNFIPTLGSIIGTILPTAFALIQFGEIAPAAVVCAGIGSVQFAIGNVLLPRMAGQSMNLSLVVTILALMLWGGLWGVTGLFLAVPLTAMIVIVAARFEATRPVAILLSRTGRLGAAPPPPGADALDKKG